MKIAEFDRSAMLRSVAWRREPFTTILRLLTYTGTGRAWAIGSASFVVLTAGFYEVVPRQPLFVRSMVAPLLAWGAGLALKRLIARPRPFETIAGFSALVAAPLGDSFPSSHAGASVAFYTALSMGHHPYAPYVGLWAAVISFSRFYLGVHYPSDIVAGSLLGVVCGYAFATLG